MDGIGNIQLFGWQGNMDYEITKIIHKIRANIHAAELKRKQNGRRPEKHYRRSRQCSNSNKEN